MFKHISGDDEVSHKRLFYIYILLSFFILAPAEAVTVDETTWNYFLKSKYFGNRHITESSDFIELTAPYRAEDPALVPLTITSKIPQKKDNYIKIVTLLIDNNPEPFTGRFVFTPESGRADLALRVRVNSYTHIRAIAELSNGQLHMHKVYVKASGGCSAPVGADLEEAMKRLGKMKFRLDNDLAKEKPALTQLLISHPNLTGMQMDQVTRLVKPAHFIEHLKVSYNGLLVLTAETDIAISQDPNFRFYFVPTEAGVLKAEIKDNKGMIFTKTLDVKAKH